MNLLVSACLLGEKVRYDGASKEVGGIWDLGKRHTLFAFCPEVSGGLPVPRPPAELKGTALMILQTGEGGVFTRQGGDVTEEFLKGAKAALAFCRENHIQAAILKEKSPSCGVKQVYDGSFQKALIPGQGLTAALLIQSGIPVYTEENYRDLVEEMDLDLPK